MNSFRFLNYKVYRDSKEFKLSSDDCIKILLEKKQFSLKDQLDRALISVSLNIAEGFSRKTNKDLKRFLLMSLGSLNETVACFDLAKDMRLISEKRFEKISEKAENVARQLSGLIRSLN